MLAMIFVPVFVHSAQKIQEARGLGSIDAPGGGFNSGDECGFVMGSTGLATSVTLDFDVITNADQGCVDENGYFYSSSSRESFARYTDYSGGPSGTNYILDFDYNTASNVFQELDPSGDYWTWTGMARILGGTIPAAQRWVDFEWTCADTSCINPETGEVIDPADYYVRTNTTTGEVAGYAWSDYFDTFISFNGLMQELPPRHIETYVDILANNSTNGPGSVDSLTAPLADGAEYWRVRVQFWDSARMAFLDPEDVLSLSITPYATGDSYIFMNQVEDNGDAIEVSYANPYVGCASSATPCTLTEESDGSESFNTFIFSGAPTSNMLGFNNDADAAIEYYSDRAGCRWIYRSQWAEVDGFPVQKRCPYPDGSTYYKEDVYYERQTDRNSYEIDYVKINATFAWEGASGSELDMYTYPDGWTEDDGSNAFVESASVSDGGWEYYFEDGTSDLSYRPRYQITKFAAVYDGAEYSTISMDIDESMNLKAQAFMADTSPAYQSILSAIAKPSYEVYYQLDADSDPSSPTKGDNYLLIDTDIPPSTPASGDVEETYRTDSITSTSFGPSPSYATYNRAYAMGYGQKTSECPTPSSCPVAANTLTLPTAEQWVCDSATLLTKNAESCYYTEYLSHIDRHQEPESMFVIGAINSTIDADEVLEEVSNTEGTVLSVLGTTETINLRNKMYAQVLRYTLGQNASSGSFDTDGNPSSGLVELMNGRLIFAEGDVTINGFDGNDKTLVVLGGDIFLNADITDGRLGIIAFKRDGVGGNVYIDSGVTETWMNLFLDGSLFSYNGITPGEVCPTWPSEEERVEALLNQLHFKGSLVSRNTVNGSAGSAPYDLGDGTTTDVYGVAREYDLNMLRQFRLCYGLNADGSLDYGTTEACDEGELLSDYGTENGYSNPFILEYNPADGLPIFTVGSGFFN